MNQEQRCWGNQSLRLCTCTCNARKKETKYRSNYERPGRKIRFSDALMPRLRDLHFAHLHATLVAVSYARLGGSGRGLGLGLIDMVNVHRVDAHLLVLSGGGRRGDVTSRLLA